MARVRSMLAGARDWLMGLLSAGGVRFWLAAVVLGLILPVPIAATIVVASVRMRKR